MFDCFFYTLAYGTVASVIQPIWLAFANIKGEVMVKFKTRYFLATLSILGIFQPQSWALVGGKVALNQDAVVAFTEKKTGSTFCTGAVVGTRPLTVITAAHCLLGASGPLDLSMGKFEPKEIIIHPSVQYFGPLAPNDLMVLVYDKKAYIPTVTQERAFIVEKNTEDLASYRGKVEMCGFGLELNQELVDQEHNAILKCGEGLYLEHESYGDGLVHELFSLKLMQCFGLAFESELKLQNISEINHGDSGGPLFRKKKGRNYLIGVNNSMALGHPEKAFPIEECLGIAAGEGYSYNFTSVGKSNLFARELLTFAKQKKGADIQGY